MVQRKGQVGADIAALANRSPRLWPSLAALGAFISVMLVIAVSRVRKRLD